jgi:hypothetical protein
MSHILQFVSYILKHSSGLDTVEYLSQVRHENHSIPDEK